jgi:hypothetical protein
MRSSSVAFDGYRGRTSPVKEEKPAPPIRVALVEEV